MRYPIRNLGVAAPNTGDYQATRMPLTLASPDGLPFMTSGWGPSPAPSREGAASIPAVRGPSNAWFGRTAFVAMPGAKGTYTGIPGF